MLFKRGERLVDYLRGYRRPAVVRWLLLAIATIPALGWLLGGWSETADAIGSWLLPALAPVALALLPVPRPARGRHWAAAALLLGVTCVALAPDLAVRRSMPAADHRAERIVVVTHNVAVANVAPERTVATLLEQDADVLLLQEVDGRFAAMLPRLRAHYRWSNPCTRRCSLAILARFPLDRVRYRSRDAQGRAFGPPLLQTVMRPPGRAPVPIVTLHLPWPIPPGRQQAERAALIPELRSLDGARAIVGGDFNLVPWSRSLRAIDAGVAPLHRITRALPSFPARVHGLAALPVLPIDHLYVGPAWRAASVARIGRGGSDHFGVRAELIAHPAGQAADAMAWRPDRERG